MAVIYFNTDLMSTVVTCKAHVIDNRRVRHQKESARRHAAATHDRQGQSRVYSSFGEHYNDK